MRPMSFPPLQFPSPRGRNQRKANPKRTNLSVWDSAMFNEAITALSLVPVEVIGVVLEYLSLKEQFSVRYVHSRWNDALTSLSEEEVCTQLPPCGLWDLNVSTQSYIRFICCLWHRMSSMTTQKVTSIYVRDWDRMTDQDVVRVFSSLCTAPTCSNLHSVWLSGCTNVGDATMRTIAQLDKLESLSLYKCGGISEKGVDSLQGVKTLQSLTFLDVPALPQCTTSIGRLTRLSRLDLTGSYRLTDKCMSQLSMLSGLAFLCVASCSQLSDSAAVEIAKLSNLETLNVSCCHFTARAIEDFSKLTKLRSLDLSECSRINDLAIAKLTNSLTILNVSGCKMLTAKSYEAFSKMLSLQLLNLSHCKRVSDESIALLAGLPDLVSFYVGGCDLVTDDGILQMLGAESLQDLNVANCPRITAVAIAQLEAKGVEVSVEPEFF